jgi:glycerophosphoryl diester phosphodiesterase
MKRLIAHRGASAYAPEQTIAAFELALAQQADAIELDVQATKDGVLVCMHDRTLDRTTNARTVYPGRRFVNDLTLDELKELDAGSWYSTAFAGARVPTLDEVFDWLGDRAALLAELKDPDEYAQCGVDLLALFADTLRRRRARGSTTRCRNGDSVVTMQSFHEPTIRRAATMFDGEIPLVVLIEPADAAEWSDSSRFASIAEFAAGIGPGKSMLLDQPSLVGWAHDARLYVTPWTFRVPAPRRFAGVRAEMAHYLTVLDVDGVITDNPDEFPRELLTARAPV